MKLNLGSESQEYLAAQAFEYAQHLPTLTEPAKEFDLSKRRLREQFEISREKRFIEI